MRILLIVYDHDSYMHHLPLGLAYIASVLLKEGFDVQIYNQDKHHYDEEHLTEFLDSKKFDVVGINAIGGYYEFAKLLKISSAVNKSKNRPFYILGGHGPSPEPEYFLNKTRADAAVMGEGENTIIELLEALSSSRSFSNIKGIAYKEGDKIIVNERRELVKDIDSIPFPAYHLFPMDYYRLMRLPGTTNRDFVAPMLSGRGCTFKCNFCYRMDEGFRQRSNESIIEEMQLLMAKYQINYIAFFDELLMNSRQRIYSLCKGFIKSKLNVKWYCNGRLNYADKDILKLMKQSGCVFINYGIESMDDTVLKNMRKCLTVKQIIKGITATQEAGILPGFNIIFGNIGDNEKTLKKSADFLLKYGDGGQFRTIRPVTPYPGSPLYYYAIKKGLLKDCADFYENKHINSDLLSVNFTELTDKEFHKCLFEANKKLISNYYKKNKDSYIKQARKLYFEKDASFRGFRQT